MGQLMPVSEGFWSERDKSTGTSEAVSRKIRPTDVAVACHWSTPQLWTISYGFWSSQHSGRSNWLPKWQLKSVGCLWPQLGFQWLLRLLKNRPLASLAMACNGYTSDAKKNLEPTWNGWAISVLEVIPTSEIAMTHDASNGDFPIFSNGAENRWKDKLDHLWSFCVVKFEQGIPFTLIKIDQNSEPQQTNALETTYMDHGIICDLKLWFSERSAWVASGKRYLLL